MRKPRYAEEFKKAAVKTSYEQGILKATARFNVPERSLSRWRKKYGSECAAQLSAKEEPEVEEAQLETTPNYLEAEQKAQAGTAPNQLEMENADLRVWVDRLEAENTDLLARVERLEAENTDLKNEEQQHKKTIAALKNALAVLASVQ